MNAPRTYISWTREADDAPEGSMATPLRHRPLHRSYLSDPSPAHTFRIHG